MAAAEAAERKILPPPLFTDQGDARGSFFAQERLSGGLRVKDAWSVGEGSQPLDHTADPWRNAFSVCCLRSPRMNTYEVAPNNAIPPATTRAIANDPVELTR